MNNTYLKKALAVIAAVIFLAAQTPALADDGYNVDGIVSSVLALRNPATNLSPSHFGHPGYDDLTFLYDQAVAAIVLKAAGYDKDAENILDYFAFRLNLPTEEVVNRLDTNGIYGLLKLVNKNGPERGSLKTIINSININSTRRQGRGQLEFWTTPGPLAFLIFAFLYTNSTKYMDEAVALGEVLLTMQRDDGGIIDGDRSPDKVHTEPHVDAACAFLMLQKITDDNKWGVAYEKAYIWFRDNVYHMEEGLIDQGMWNSKPNDIFAVDAYSWTMAGPFGNRMSSETMKRLTERMLEKSLVSISLVLPDGSAKTLTLCDFSDPTDIRVKSARGGYHPLGTVEWTGGAILAIKKNAVRMWQRGEKEDAGFYKAMAENLSAECADAFYAIDGTDSMMTFYATGQGYEVAPFGSVRSGFIKGWKTPFYHAKGPDDKTVIKGGSLVGIWPLIPHLGINPFILDDTYNTVYKAIPMTGEDKDKARDYFNIITAERSFIEDPFKRDPPSSSTQIIEPAMFNREMLKALEAAYASGDEDRAGFKEVIKWAHKTLSNGQWIEYAIRDNKVKKHEFSGIIRYPWGRAFPGNNHPLHSAILRYPLLNEVALAMWGMATAYYELDDYKNAKKWMSRIIDEVPLHQIPDTDERLNYEKSGTIIGYWNALITWEDVPTIHERDIRMGELYRQLLKDRGVVSAKPRIVELPDKYLSQYYDKTP